MKENGIEQIQKVRKYLKGGPLASVNLHSHLC